MSGLLARAAARWLFIVFVAAFASVSPALAAESVWKSELVPAVWKKAPPGKDNHLWYRTRVMIPADWQGRKLELVVEAADDAREIYVGGERIGTLGSFPPAYRSGLGETKRLTVPVSAVQFGQSNLVAIRVCNIAARSGFNVAAPVLFGGDQAIRMSGAWETANGDDLAWAKASAASVATPAFDQLEPAAVVERELKKLAGEEGPLAPAESHKRMRTPADLRVDLVLSEPHIGQPLSMKWDSRGRLWVVQYLQYPNPAGLTMLSRDKFLRSVYDKVPPAPPNHFPGADKISIHEDTDGDGKLDKHTSFVEGLSLLSAFEFGRGGVWVLNPPYLLFYPDANGDDVPDGDPVVHLEGFGIEDSHSIASHLCMGPDGWLYATQGSTVTGDIKRPGEKQAVHSLGQLVWRYHPEQRKYEIFAEGGGNSFGLEIDAKGRIYSGHNGGNTRGFHFVQGGYYQKGFGKHGELSNLYTFGYFEAMKHHDVPRFTHTFVIYDGGALPQPYQGRIFGVGPLQSHVVMAEVSPDRSSFQSRDVGFALETPDTWFRPVDIQVGPDGGVYVADMYEQRIDHASHYQGRIDKTSGRIYRLIGKDDSSKPQSFNLAKEPSLKLLDRLASTNKWFRQAAQQELLRRQDKSVASEIFTRLQAADGQIALEYLWAFHNVSGLNDEQILKLVDHADPYVRLWTARLACDDGQVSQPVAARLADIAYREPHVEVRSQLASSARRLPADQSLALVKSLASHSEDVDDVHLPLLIWWAIEAKADTHRDQILALFQDQDFWNQPMVSTHIIEKLMRRYASTGQRKDLITCAKLLSLAPGKERAGQLMAGLEAAYEGRTLDNLPKELAAAMLKAGATSPTLRLRQGDASAVSEALELLGDDSADAAKRQQLAVLFGTINQPSCVPVLIKVLKQSRNDALRSAALASLQSYSDESIGATVVDVYSNLPDHVRETAQSLLASRKVWAEQFLSAIDAGRIDARTVTEATQRKLQLHSSPTIAALSKKHFGELAGASPEQIRAEIDKITSVIGAASGNPYEGKKLFTASCGKCHVLFAEGGKIGPDLTVYKRDDLRGMLLNVLNPSAEIREGFENFAVLTTDGRALTGFIADQDANVVVIRGADGQNITIPREDIDEMTAVRQSVMPEGLLKDLSQQQIRDLFAYLRATQPLN